MCYKGVELLLTASIFPLLGVLAAWRFSVRAGPGRVRWRRTLFTTGLLVTALSASVLLVFVIHCYVAAHGTTPRDLDRVYPVLSMLGLAFVGATLASFGKGASRVVLSASGLLAAVLWYLAGLAASG